MQTNSYEVRAMPAQGHDYRWCAGLPWGKKPKRVVVVDKAPEITKEYLGDFVHKDEVQVSASQLDSLKKDRLLAVSSMGEHVAGQDELNAAKSKVIDLEKQIARERLEHQTLVEEKKAFVVSSMKQIEDQGAKIVELEAEVSSLRAQIAERRKGK